MSQLSNLMKLVIYEIEITLKKTNKTYYKTLFLTNSILKDKIEKNI
jgi:hypothetical protein